MTVTPTKTDAVLLAAADLARGVLEEVAEPGTIGAHLGMDLLEERLGMHWFECTSPGYRGWRWGVSVARVSRAKVATVCETNLLPGPDAVLAPEWLPYADRLAPGDLGAGDVLPYRPDDPNLEYGFEATGDEDVDQMAFFELGLGRPRVLSAEGREVAATRWYEGEAGPTSEIALKATAQCTTCGYFLPMAGALRATFGVCANEWSPSDGRVVSLDHGCGAHSETDMDHPEPTSVGDPIVDEFAVDLEPAERAAEDATPAEPTGEDETPVEEIPVEELPTEETSSVEAPDEEQHGSDDPVTD
ncbi:DUF3027 domain-containing protein [Terrabacter sp. MAHUQ-38]|uniref:DUF3027 domain-containing protein n=1 Tax=unclassified Terrabacter TaxID=2630222 RepID=UPI00165D3282|nr:DUF3027 domain-containing protein [Terrabacter sp. MAHUQ-38]MBC9822213.1 DUF3027 domain-containing protein [Terrabacter sp. MAHUQ-38]